MRNDKLRSVFDNLGFADVGSVLSSGNMVFRTDQQDSGALEDRIGQALSAKLGIGGGTIVRTRAELSALIDSDPFNGRGHSRETYLTATFFKQPPQFSIKELPTLAGVDLIGYDRAARCALAVTDTTSPQGPELRVWLERNFGRDITTRTWLTVHRIVAKLPSD